MFVLGLLYDFYRQEVFYKKKKIVCYNLKFIQQSSWL